MKLKTESETGERRFRSPHTPYGRVRLARFARVRLLRHALPILRKKPTVLQSTFGPPYWRELRSSGSSGSSGGYMLYLIFLSQVIFVFLCFFGMVMYANEVESKRKTKITWDKKLTTTKTIFRLAETSAFFTRADALRDPFNQNSDQFDREKCSGGPVFSNSSGWTEPILWVLDRNFSFVWMDRALYVARLYGSPNM